jgi:hypothetical protein
VAIPGGSAAKWGELYEGRWTVFTLLRVLDEDADAIRIEQPGEDFAEFVVRVSGRTEYHQAKRAFAQSGRWSIKMLLREDVLVPFKEKLESGGHNRCVFVSGQDADHLRALSKGARGALSPQEFADHFLSSEALKQSFRDLHEGWAIEETRAIELLKHVWVQTIDEDTLLDVARSRAEKLVDARPEDVVALLAELALSSINKELRADDIWRAIEQGGRRRRDWTTDPHTHTRFTRATQDFVDQLHARTIGGVVIERAEAHAATAAFDAGQKIVLVAGEAGAGKSLVLLQTVEELRQRMPVLAFRADGVEPSRSPEKIGADLGLPGSPATVLAAVADGGDALLVIDQLDATSTASGRQAEFFEGIQKLLNEARSYERIRVLLACRQFDLDNDRRLRTLVSDDPTIRSIPVGSLPRDAVVETLERVGISPSDFDERQLRLLELPLHLQLVSEIAAAATGEASAFRTVSDLYSAFWELKQDRVASRLNRSPRWTEVIDRLCDHMSGRQILSAPRELLDELRDDAQAMASENVIVFQGARVSFFHEGFFDYSFVRRFVGRGGSLEDLLADGEQHLFRRPQVRQFLAYERSLEGSRYLTDLEAVLRG